MKIATALLAALSLYSPLIMAQCAPGIPSAGNPGCIPPNQPNSPYYEGSEPQTVQAAPPVWADRWGAIAIDDDSGKGGTVSSASSKSRAESEAMERCVENGGIRCKLLITYHNQCVAASQKLSGGSIEAFRAATTPRAEQLALDSCGGGQVCRIIYSKCSDAVRIR